MKKQIMKKQPIKKQDAALFGVIRSAMQEAIKEACRDVMSNEDVWREISGYLEEWIDRTEVELSFENGEPIIWLTIGGMDYNDPISRDFPVEICRIRTYKNPDKAAKQDINDQITGIDKMIAQLTEWRLRLAGYPHQPSN